MQPKNKGIRPWRRQAMVAEGESRQRYRFGEFTLDLERGSLVREGADVRLRPKSYSVLTYLVRHAGRLIAKEELLDAVWGHQFGSEDSLTQCIIEIRRALGDDTHEILRTVPRRGFIFELAVTAGDGPQAGQQTRDETSDPRYPAQAGSARLRITRFAALVLLLLVLGLLLQWYPGSGWPPFRAQDPSLLSTSIAVLPFEDMSPGSDQQYLADGLAEELLNAFTQVPGLRVIARTSSFQFRETNSDISAIAEKLEVDHLLEGSVRKSGERVRVTAQLIDGERASHIWSKTYERELGDILALQQEIASDVANSLQLTLSGEATGRAAPPPHPRAYRNFLQARHFWQRRSAGDIELAGRYFKRAVEIDPGFARAWAGLAGFYWARAGNALGSEEGVRMMGAALERSLSNDPTLPEAHARAWAYYRITGNERLAEKHAARAREYGENSPLVISYGLMGNQALREGRYDWVLERQRKLMRINPLSAVTYGNAGHELMAIGRLEEAKSAFRKANDLNPSLKDEHKSILTLIKVLQDRHEEAVADARTLPEGPDRHQILAMAHFSLGRMDQARKAMELLQARQDGDGAFRIAEVYAYRGDADSAFEWLARIPEQVSDADMVGRWPPWETRLRVSPCLRILRDDARWEPLIKRLPRRPPIEAPPLPVSLRLFSR